MASFQITQVNVELSASSNGSYHEHIAAVMTAEGLKLDRATVVNDILFGDDSYYTYGGGARADVVVRGCPYCSFGAYITTAPDYTTENNLLSLPRF